jgi:hypothetical protein
LQRRRHDARHPQRQHHANADIRRQQHDGSQACVLKGGGGVVAGLVAAIDINLDQLVDVLGNLPSDLAEVVDATSRASTFLLARDRSIILAWSTMKAARFVEFGGDGFSSGLEISFS